MDLDNSSNSNSSFEQVSVKNFVLKSDKSHAGNVTAKEKAKEFPNDKYENDNELFYKAYNKAIDHKRQSMVTAQFETETFEKKIGYRQ